MDDIHSCSYYCDNPPCIKRQRDEMREKLFKEFEREARSKDSSVETVWVGLTDEEIYEANAGGMWVLAKCPTKAFARAIESKLKEKNT